MAAASDPGEATNARNESLGSVLPILWQVSSIERWRLDDLLQPFDPEEPLDAVVARRSVEEIAPVVAGILQRHRRVSLAAAIPALRNLAGESLPRHLFSARLVNALRYKAWDQVLHISVGAIGRLPGIGTKSVTEFLEVAVAEGLRASLVSAHKPDLVARLACIARWAGDAAGRTALGDVITLRLDLPPLDEAARAAWDELADLPLADFRGEGADA